MTRELPTIAAPQLLPVEAAAERMSVCRATIFNMIRRGELRSVKIGRVRRIPVDAIVDFIEQQLQAA